jgi:hypothetical protein
MEGGLRDDKVMTSLTKAGRWGWGHVNYEVGSGDQLYGPYERQASITILRHVTAYELVSAVLTSKNGGLKECDIRFC